MNIMEQVPSMEPKENREGEGRRLIAELKKLSEGAQNQDFGNLIDDAQHHIRRLLEEAEVKKAA